MIDESHKELVVFRYRGKDLTADDITFINEVIERDYSRGRSYIARQLCEAWQWRQPNGNLKEYASRDLLLRLEEKDLILLPPRKRPKNNGKIKSFDQIPLFLQKPLEGMVGDYSRPVLRELRGAETYLWDFLIHHYHYLGLPTLVGEHLKQVATIDGQIVACLGWASSAWKVRDRDAFIGWNQATRRQNLHLIANNVRFLIPEWVRIKHLASKVLSLSLSCLNERWLTNYGHGLALAETFVDTARFQGTCYRAANWVHVGQTSGSAKKGWEAAELNRPTSMRPYHTSFASVLSATPVNKSVRVHRRVIEDIAPIQPRVTEHIVNGYWCSTCKKIVTAKVTEALPNAKIGLRLVVFTAWLHYLVGVSVDNLVSMRSVLSSVKISAGGLTQAWNALAGHLWYGYVAIGQRAAKSAVLHADETGWRLNGVTHWLWCFTTKSICCYVITKSRGSPVVKQVLGLLFKGILICDFWGAYNKISTLATQRCFFHLFTELVKVDKHNSSQNWKAFRKKLSRLMKEAIGLSENKEISTQHRDRLIVRLHIRLDEMIAEQYEDNDPSPALSPKPS